MPAKTMLRLSACGAAVAALMATAISPAQAASTEGTKITVRDTCTELAPDMTSCLSMTERRIEVHAPSGISVLQGYREYSTSTTYPDGSYTSDGTRRYVYVYSSRVEVPDGTIYFDPQVARVDGSDVLSFADGLTCVLDTNLVEANGTGGYNHSTGSCTYS
ncbi:hypothetical protein F8G81_21275 [Arthrobacter sp. CDRTa11]|uniref:hypothetical protein n=1 Tax=Arthrobacter sp. CDRTa11 TaxID=2651199 RepID=UPI002265DC04|nr:hypothetical protein [Arthrobacter sp. CDRTa11]UZX04840.1 hypothetical protein F8G81_21275 [Arthrobacter sp. CDRTa11]